jgi:hypothetical protein
MSIRALNICILYSPSFIVFIDFSKRQVLENPRDISQAGSAVWGVEGAAPVLAAPAVRVGIGEMSPLAAGEGPAEDGQYGCTKPTTTVAVGEPPASALYIKALPHGSISNLCEVSEIPHPKRGKYFWLDEISAKNPDLGSTAAPSVLPIGRNELTRHAKQLVACGR